MRGERANKRTRKKYDRSLKERIDNLDERKCVKTAPSRYAKKNVTEESKVLGIENH